MLFCWEHRQTLLIPVSVTRLLQRSDIEVIYSFISVGKGPVQKGWRRRWLFSLVIYWFVSWKWPWSLAWFMGNNGIYIVYIIDSFWPKTVGLHRRFRQEKGFAVFKVTLRWAPNASKLYEKWYHHYAYVAEIMAANLRERYQGPKQCVTISIFKRLTNHQKIWGIR